MKLSPEQIALLRNALIRQLAAAGSIGLPLSTLLMGVKMAGFEALESADLDPHLHFIVSDGLATLGYSTMSAGLKRWTITANGTRYAEQHGLA